MPFQTPRVIILVVILLSATTVIVAATDVRPVAPLHERGAVFVMTNAADRNEVLMFHRSVDGTLVPLGRFATGGRGTGGALTAAIDPLGSQGSLILAQDRRLLFAVNAGSDELSVFEVRPDRLRLLDVHASGGAFPVSLAQRGKLLYALNGGGDGNISGFTIGVNGRLAPILGSTRLLHLDGTNPPDLLASPAQIQFTPRGRELIMSDKGNDRIMAFSVGRGGLLAAAPTVNPSEGPFPFGFTFVDRDLLLVSEPLGAVSSYRVTADGRLTTIGSSVPSFGLATCWIVARGRHAYATNTGSHDISGYRVAADGTLDPIGAEGVTFRFDSEAFPTDAAVAGHAPFLYTLNAGTGTIGILRIEEDGELILLGEVGGLPVFDGAQGIAAF